MILAAKDFISRRKFCAAERRSNTQPFFESGNAPEQEFEEPQDE
jgi:hypothetical protein